MIIRSSAGFVSDLITTSCISPDILKKQILKVSVNGIPGLATLEKMFYVEKREQVGHVHRFMLEQRPYLGYVGKV